MSLPTFQPPPSFVASLSSEKQPTLFSRLFNAAARVENFINKWTPFVLTASYFIFSTCVYMICSPELITIFWFIYLTTNFYIAGSTVVEAVMSMTPSREARKAVEKVAGKNWIFPTPNDSLLILDIVIVAYLPNEKDIIMDRIQYATDKIVYPRDKIRINVVYNTPRPIEPLETQLRELAAKIPHLRLHKVVDSTSKADNLNYFFTLNTGSDIIAVFDCDHYPQPYGPRWAAECLIADPKTDIVQGRCVIFNTASSWLAAMIGVEFDKIYAVSHPGRAALWDFGLFTGSNGYWRSSLIRDLKMDKSMLTEDIDSSLRALSRCSKIVHDPNVVSYELAPTKLKAFWNQRLRWAQGWAQASLKHTKLAFIRSPDDQRTKTQRFGLISLLLIREMSYYLVTQYCCLVLSIIITSFPKSGTLLFHFLFFQYPVAFWLFILR